MPCNHGNTKQFTFTWTARARAVRNSSSPPIAVRVKLRKRGRASTMYIALKMGVGQNIVRVSKFRESRIGEKKG